MLKVLRRNVNSLWKTILTPIKLVNKPLEMAHYRALMPQVVLWVKLLTTLKQKQRNMKCTNRLTDKLYVDKIGWGRSSAV